MSMEGLFFLFFGRLLFYDLKNFLQRKVSRLGLLFFFFYALSWFMKLALQEFVVNFILE